MSSAGLNASLAQWGNKSRLLNQHVGGGGGINLGVYDGSGVSSHLLI